ncbi:hypothetical protein VTN00DRAFT_9565 [Thermoascus crustaceus]|uniref:uncharacterized protein n=1 Tax=Thermoascus crustaceus TaxID=5088 RepID=UPI0037437460
MGTLLASAWSFLSLFQSQEVLQRATSLSPSPNQEEPLWYGGTPVPDLFQSYSPSHPYGINDDELYGHSIFRRDSCGDAFGPGAANSQCAPSITLCCVRTDNAYPSCQQHLNKGWCCIGNNATDNCYVDQPSACDEENSVPCTNLAKGTTKACCPRLTSCATNFAASNIVRCNIQYGDLMRAAASSSSSSSSSSTAAAASTATENASTSTSVSTPTSQTTTTPSTPISNNPPPTTPYQPLSSAIIAGIAVASVAGLALLATLIWFLIWRKKKEHQHQHNSHNIDYPSQYAEAAGNPIAPGPYGKSSSPQMGAGTFSSFPVEIGSSGTKAAELPSSPAQTTRYELGMPCPRI